MGRQFGGKFTICIFGGLLVFLAISSLSIAQVAPEKAASFSLNKIEVRETAEGSRVIIEATRPFEYTATRSATPPCVSVEIPGAQLGKLAGPIAVRNRLIQSIQTREFQEAGKKGARVEIAVLHQAVHRVKAEGNRVYVDVERPAGVSREGQNVAGKPEKPPAAAKALKEITVSPQSEGVAVAIRGDGTLPEPQSLRLAGPPRLVLDFPKVARALPKNTIHVGSRFLSEIRVGSHPEKSRVVFTFPGAKVLPYELKREGREVTVLLGSPGAGQARNEEPAKAEPAATPVSQKEKIETPGPTASADILLPVAPAKEIPAPVQEAKARSKAAEVPLPAPVEKTVAVSPLPPPKPVVLKKEAAPEVKSPEPAGIYKGVRISLDFKDADIHNIFRLIAEVSNLNIITSEEVRGKITIRLVNVPWDQALDIVLVTKNLVKIEEGNVLRITTIENMRRELEDKQKEETTLIKSMENRDNAEELVTEAIRLNYAKATDLQKVLLGSGGAGGAKPLLGLRGSVRADERTNTLIIKDTRGRAEEMLLLVRRLDIPTPQVLIEARVVQAVTTFARSLGVQWGGSYNQTGNKYWGLTGNDPLAAAGWGFIPSALGATTPGILPSNFVVNFPAPTGNTPVGGMGVSFGKITGNLLNLDLRLSLGETEGQTRVIARPKLATLDNTKAHIKQGELIPYETVSQAGTQVQFIDAVLLLEVTPHITPDGSIKMNVKVTRDARGSFRSPINQVPSIDKREAETEVLVKDGDTLVIGGIYESENDMTTQGIPWVKKVPVLGWLFKNEEVINLKKELLIFVTPTIIQAKSDF